MGNSEARGSVIVCGVTGSARAHKAAVEAAVFARETNARLVYVYAIDTSFLNGATSLPPISFVEERLELLGSHVIDCAVELGRLLGVTAKSVLMKGPVLEVLKQVVAEEKADLLVIGHEDKPIFEKVLASGDPRDHEEQLKHQTSLELTIVS